MATGVQFKGNPGLLYANASTIRRNRPLWQIRRTVIAARLYVKKCFTHHSYYAILRIAVRYFSKGVAHGSYRVLTGIDGGAGS